MRKTLSNAQEDLNLRFAGKLAVRGDRPSNGVPQTPRCLLSIILVVLIASLIYGVVNIACNLVRARYGETVCARGLR